MNVESVSSAIRHVLRVFVPPLFNLAFLSFLLEIIFGEQIKHSAKVLGGNISEIVGQLYGKIGTVFASQTVAEATSAMKDSLGSLATPAITIIMSSAKAGALFLLYVTVV